MNITIHNNNPSKGTSITIALKSIFAFLISATSVYLILTLVDKLL
jgi:hypothetical protein